MTISIIPTSLPGVKIIDPKVFGDARGLFFESFNARDFSAAIGEAVVFVQDSHSVSAKNVLRGLHYQIQRPQGKLVRVIAGEVFDVVVDIRRHSPNFGRWAGAKLSAENKLQLWVPAGFAHGFVVLTESAEVLYKSTDYRYPQHERSLLWNDASVAIKWPIETDPILSPRDAMATRLTEAEVFT